MLWPDASQPMRWAGRREETNRQHKETQRCRMASPGLAESLLSWCRLRSVSSPKSNICLCIFVNFLVSLWGQQTGVFWAVYSRSSLWTEVRKTGHRSPGEGEPSPAGSCTGSFSCVAGALVGIALWLGGQSKEQTLRISPSFLI